MFKDTVAFSSFSVTDMDAARAFYGDTLGVEINGTAEGLNLVLDGTSVFIYPKPNHTPATFTVLNFVVDDIDAAVDEMIAKGIEFEHYDGGMSTDKKGIFRHAGKGPAIAWFKDPSGNFLAVMEEA